jgi:hypothetical protein
MQSSTQISVRRYIPRYTGITVGRNGGRIFAAITTLLISCGTDSALAQTSTTSLTPTETLQRAAAAEDWIQSGRLHVLKTINMPRPNAELLKELKASGKYSKLDLEIATTFPEHIKEDFRLTFDVKRKVILTEGTRDNEINRFKNRISNDHLRTFTHSDLKTNEYKDEVHTQKPVWPPSWPYNLLIGSLWGGRLDGVKSGELKPTLANRTSNGEQFIYIAGGPKAQLDQKIWFNPTQNYAVSRLEFYEKKSKRLMEQVVITNRKQHDAVYPQRIEDTFFSYRQNGKPYIARAESTTIENVDINVALSDGELAFGDIPKNAFVQDHRFSRMLIYVQGDKQFTDQDLFAALKDPSILNSSSTPLTSRTSGSRPPLVALGLVLLVVAVALWRRQRAATA